jgi:hypothetical protein
MSQITGYARDETEPGDLIPQDHGGTSSADVTWASTPVPLAAHVEFGTARSWVHQ